MHVIASEAGAIIHSPTLIDETTFERVAALEPRVILAPNHYHHLGLSPYRERFPSAVVTADAAAIRRLEQRGHQSVRPLSELALPSGVRAFVPPGTKSGETWLVVDDAEGPTLLVCDAFFHQLEPVRGLEGALLRWLKIAPGLAIGVTFTQLVLGDKAGYRRAVLEFIEHEQPRRVLFSHGVPLETDAAHALREIAEQRLA
jgi:hypothetical protein